MRRYLFLDPAADVTRRDVFELAHARGMGVALVSRALRRGERERVDAWFEADPTDPGAVLACAQAAGPLAGVVNCSESCLLAASTVVEELDLRGIRPPLAELCRDKVAMAERLAEAGVPLARRRVVRDEQAALAAAAQIGLPGVLKPSTGVASLYTVKYASLDELSGWFRRFSAELAVRTPAPLRTMAGRWLVEEYLDGVGLSVESVTSGGRTVHVAICRKGETTPPFFREVGHSSPAGLAPAVRAELTRLTRRAIAALGLDECVTHAEFKATSNGLRLLEIGARMGGGSIRQVVRGATGVDLLAVTLDLARGMPPSLRRTRRVGVASRSFFPARPGRLVHLDVERLLALPGVVEVNAWMQPGDVYQLPPASYREVLGVVTRAAHPETAVARADAAIAQLEADGIVELAAPEAAA